MKTTKRLIFRILSGSLVFAFAMPVLAEMNVKGANRAKPAAFVKQSDITRAKVVPTNIRDSDTNLELDSTPKMYKWTDENGKVHFGDMVPDKYRSEAEALKVAPTNTIAPDESIRLQNQAAAEKLRRQKALQKANTQQKPSVKPNSSGFKLSREYCRDNTKTVKQRTDCFKKVDQQNR